MKVSTILNRRESDILSFKSHEKRILILFFSTVRKDRLALDRLSSARRSVVIIRIDNGSVEVRSDKGKPGNRFQGTDLPNILYLCGYHLESSHL